MSRFFRWFFLLSLPLFVADQVSKHWVVERFFPPGHPAYFAPENEIELAGSALVIHRIHNRGVAFGMFNDLDGPWQNLIFGSISLTVMVVLIIAWAKGAFPTLAPRIAIALLVSGILGNVTDRFLHGYVVDFVKVDLGFPPFNPWPSFNVADSCITIAAILLFVSAFYPQARSQSSIPSQSPDKDEGQAAGA